ncbi:hypothetical protein EHI8A_118260 [Entamoeba histolytica HM-1:IMSS-B]|nr:hypothetical protein EHI8A_118260 [Entamoeba histolytica HM-1:IMSS-B]EMS14593.1 DNA double-strand break repair Rad50 ATPase, putative [Entamoeba histolytica HM-3:IMSS]ENY60006.1 DNA double-strand break repair Rad50 ATPase, putative [Entamoeba histolytica HM-1:IMSS-A]GAT93312.1 hypothetical protein CL6EHI_159770 [Entamoeba histolytica]
MEVAKSLNHKRREMKQLETVYLMKVVLHVKDMNDIQNIEMVNKKCRTAINSLKVNPWFTSERDVNKFCKIFNPQTCNCNLLDIDASTLMKAENLRNYNLCHLDALIKRHTKNIQPGQEQAQINKIIKFIATGIQKMESLTCVSFLPEQLIEVVIQNMKKGIKIRCDEMFAERFDEMFDKMKMDESMYPSEMIIQGNVTRNWIKNGKKKNVIIIFEFSLLDNVLMDIPKWVKVYSSEIVISKSNDKRDVIPFSSPIDSLFSNVVLPKLEESDNTMPGVKVTKNDIMEEESREKVYKILNDLYSNAITFYFTPTELVEQNQKRLIPIEIPQLPEFVKHFSIKAIYSKFIINNKQLEYLEVDGQQSSVELQSTSNLKSLKLSLINEIKIKEPNEQQAMSNNKRRYWKEIKEIENTFPNLEELKLERCFNLDINIPSKKLKSIEMIDSRECKINVKSDCIETLKLLRNNQTQIKLSTNKSTDINIKICSMIKLEIESQNKQNIEIIEGNQISVESKCPINKLLIAQSKQVNITGDERCNTLKVVDSTIKEIDIKPKRVVFKLVEEYIKVPLKDAEEIYIVSMKDYIFEELFDKCKKLCIDECENCQFIINKNQINEMKITNCKNTEIKGELDNIEEIITIDNEECNIPETKNIIKEDTEIIEINNTKKDIEIETDKKHIIIRNIHDSNIKIKSDINSDVTIENGEEIMFYGEFEHYGNVQFINCQNSANILNVGFVKSLLITNCESIDFSVNRIKGLLEVVDSYVGIGVSTLDNSVNIDTVHIKNSELLQCIYIICKKLIINNSAGIIEPAISQCQEELTLKSIKNKKFRLTEQLKKIEMEKCSKLNIESDVKGKEVKMVKCHQMKIVDTSNSINQIECNNVEVITEQQNEMMGGFRMMRGFGGGNMPMERPL